MFYNMFLTDTAFYDLVQHLSFPYFFRLAKPKSTTFCYEFINLKTN